MLHAKSTIPMQWCHVWEFPPIPVPKRFDSAIDNWIVYYTLGVHCSEGARFALRYANTSLDFHLRHFLKTTVSIIMLEMKLRTLLL